MNGLGVIGFWSVFSRIRTRITTNTGTFYAVTVSSVLPNTLIVRHGKSTKSEVNYSKVYEDLYITVVNNKCTIKTVGFVEILKKGL